MEGLGTGASSEPGPLEQPETSPPTLTPLPVRFASASGDPGPPLPRTLAIGTGGMRGIESRYASNGAGDNHDAQRDGY